MLRRKRGGDYDGLSDSDDGGEARRRMKRRQFAKMQKALFADERVSKVAENPRNMAFLRTIEDLGSDDDDAMAFILEPTAPVAVDASQESAAIPDSQPGTTTTATATSRVGERLPAPQRRSGRDGKKPANIGQIRESLSNLLEDPNATSVIPASDLASDSDADAEDEDGGNNHPRRQGSSDKENRNPRRHAVAVVDRLTLKRNASSISTSSSTTNNDSATTSNGRRHRPAFAAPSSSSSTNAFKVPALLRRATTNSLTSGSTSAGAGEEAEATTKVRKVGGGASRRSGVNYFAREGERRAAAAQRERRREERRWKGAEGRGSVVGGLFGMGKFE
jgi:mediator of replication checkpoint protein 1